VSIAYFTNYFCEVYGLSPFPDNVNFVGRLTLYQIKNLYKQSQKLKNDVDKKLAHVLYLSTNIQSTAALNCFKEFMQKED